nr:MAG TPA: hypothetical protein [Caudoviricetes sp.]
MVGKQNKCRSMRRHQPTVLIDRHANHSLKI